MGVDGALSPYPFNAARNAAAVWDSTAPLQRTAAQLRLPSPDYFLLVDVESVLTSSADGVAAAVAAATPHMPPQEPSHSHPAFIVMALQEGPAGDGSAGPITSAIMTSIRRVEGVQSPPCGTPHSEGNTWIDWKGIAQGIANSTLTPFHSHDHPPAYNGLVNLSTWVAQPPCFPPHLTPYSLGFEPYAVQAWPLPEPFDTSYRGYGFSKSVWWLTHCAYGRCALAPLPGIALLARPDTHPSALTSAQRNDRRNTAAFAATLQAHECQTTTQIGCSVLEQHALRDAM